MSEEELSSVQSEEVSSEKTPDRAETNSGSVANTADEKVGESANLLDVTSSETMNVDASKNDSMTDAELEQEEAKLDELDNRPENKRRARIILTSIVVLFLFAIVTIVVVPPLSWSPQKGMKSEFHTVSAVENVQSGQNPVLELVYVPFMTEADKSSDTLKYVLHLEQLTKYDHDAFAKIEMDAHIVISKPAKRDSEEEIDIQIEDVELRLLDDKKEVPMSSTSTMISGISVRALLDSKNGMSSIIPPATKINPQTARILFTVSDALRQILPPLPDGKIGENAEWELRDTGGENAEYIRRGKVKASQIVAQGVNLETSLSLYRASDLNVAIGTGRITSIMKDGIVREAKVEYHRTAAAYEGGSSEQETNLTFTYEGSE